MRYRVLGTTQAVTATGESIALGGARLRALLTVLALEPGRVRTPEALIGEVWAGDDPPADATGALQALIGRLRRALGHDAVVSAAGGYRLCADHDAIDLHRFARLADEGARALDDGDPAKAATLLDDALVLWRGPALADLPDREGAHASTLARWTARRLDARRTRAAAALALGEPAAVLPELAALCAEHPLDEPLRALHLRALRDSGRTAEALAAYEDTRRAIADRLGADPGPELRALHAELLAPPERPEPPSGPEPVQGNLRARLTSFVGRESDLAALRADLAGERLVTLTGPGGAGKTRLAQEAAEKASAAAPDRWPDGVWLAELAPVEGPDSVADAVLTALGRETVLRGSATDALRVADPLDRLAEHCGPRRMLLVLDNCEHVIEAAAVVAERLLTLCPGVAVLATSREPLAVPGESVRPVEPLPDPTALRLLADRGAAARGGFTVADDPAACAEICHRLDGLPLAIELAAARLRLLTPRQLADRLDDRFRLLTSGSRTVLPRQQTLRAVVDWSWELLDEPERAVLRRLSVFAGGCDLPAAEAVCADGAGALRPGPEGDASAPPAAGGDAGAPGPAAGGDASAPRLAPEDVAAHLGALVDKSLVIAAPAEDGGMRYRLLETVREYARDRLTEAPAEREAAERRHLTHFRELARTSDPQLRGPGQRARLAKLQLEQDNLRAALRHAVAIRDEHEALSLVLSLGWFWMLLDLNTEARTWTLAAAELGPSPFAEPVAPAPPLLQASTDVPPPLPEDLLIEARRGVRLLAMASVGPDMQVLRSEESMAEMRGIVAAYRPGLPQTCRVPGFLWFYAGVLTGEFEQVKHIIETGVQTSRQLGYDWELAFALQLRSKIYNDRPGGLEQSTRDADESLEIFERIGDAWGISEALASRGEAHERRGEYAAAAADYERAVRCATDLGAHAQVPMLRSRLGAMLIETGERETGERMLHQAWEDSRTYGYEGRQFARMQLAIHYGRIGETAVAREHFEEMAVELGPGVPELFHGMVLGFIAWVDCLEGRYEDALPRLRAAVTGTQDALTYVIAPNLWIIQLCTAAWAWAGLGEAERGARLLGAYDTLRMAPRGVQALPVERENRERVESLVRERLGDDARYDRAYEEGTRLSRAEAGDLV